MGSASLLRKDTQEGKMRIKNPTVNGRTESSSGEGKAGMIPMPSWEPGVGESCWNCAGGSEDAQLHLSCWSRAERRDGREIREGYGVDDEGDEGNNEGSKRSSKVCGWSRDENLGCPSKEGIGSKLPQEEGRNLGSWEGVLWSRSLPRMGFVPPPAALLQQKHGEK